MCGIAGEICLREDLTKQDPQRFKEMQKTMKRRGPDEDGLYISKHAALIHARLSVVDLENGKQPMSFRQGEEEYILVYNGELYNTNELRKELEGLGHHFREHSDTEVLLHSYVEWKENCVQYLNGIFAFAVWEEHNQRLFLARDRIGVKPLFYTVRGERLLFASEIKALLKSPFVQSEIDKQGIAELLLVGPGRTPGYGIFKEIEEVPSACMGFFQKNTLHIENYWKLIDKEHMDSFDQTVEKVRFLVLDAARRQLVADVPVCTFLSGGLDSSILSAAAAKVLSEKGEQLHTFSVGYKDNEEYFKKSLYQPDSDDKYIDIMSNHLGSIHHKVVIDTPMLVDALYDAVVARDLPGMADIDSSLLLFCREVKKYCTVALSGECADEIFGGYPWYRNETIRNKDGFPWSQSTLYRAGFLKGDVLSEINPEKYVKERYLKTVEDTSKCERLSATESRMKEMMRLNLDWFMQTLLDRKDRMSMYNGLEVRVPFCDYRIAEYLYSVPWEFKEWQQREKGLLRKAMEGILPDEVLWRKKNPYPKTHHPEYLQAVSERLMEIIIDPNAPLLQIVDGQKLSELLTSNLSTPWYGQLMTTPQTIAYFIQLNYWLERYQVQIV